MGRDAGTTVFDGQKSNALMLTALDSYRATTGRVDESVMQQVAQQLMQQKTVSADNNMAQRKAEIDPTRDCHRHPLACGAIRNCIQIDSRTRGNIAAGTLGLRE